MDTKETENSQHAHLHSVDDLLTVLWLFISALELNVNKIHTHSLYLSHSFLKLVGKLHKLVFFKVK